MSSRWRFHIRNYGIALLACAAATFVRWLFDPAVHEHRDYFTYTLAIIFVSWFCGPGPALFTLAISGLIATLFFVSPNLPAQVDRAQTLVELGIFYLIGLAIVLFGEGLRRARLRAEAAVADAQHRRGQLEKDIVRRRKAEQAKIAAEARLGMAMKAAQLGAWEVDIATQTFKASSMVRGWLEVDKDALVPLENFYALVHPEDRWRVRWAIEDALACRRDYDIEYRIVTPAGEQRDLASRGRISRDETGRAARLTGITLDLTDRKTTTQNLRDSEDRFKLASEAAHALFYDWDLVTSRVHRSDGLYLLLGFEPTEVPYDVSWWRTRMHQDDYVECRKRLEDAMDSLGVFAMEYRARHKEGHWIWIWDRGIIVRDGKTPIRIVGCAIDVTQQKRIEVELRVAKESAESSDRAKDQFLAVLSHELRTPLTPVLGAVRTMMRDPKTPPHLLDELEMIRRNVELESRLIDDMLDLTRVARGKIDLQLAEVDVHNSLRHAIEICRGEIRDKNLTLQLQFSAERSHVSADPARLQQIFWNVLKNAVKFTPTGGSIFVATSVHHGWLRVTVTDTGIGIESDAIDRIFDAFEQANPAIGRSFGGLGLGLAISRTLAVLHGGDLTAASAGTGQGSTFTLELPLAAVIVPKPDVEPERPATITPDHSLRILLVEDHHDTANVMSRLLSSSGHRVTVARTMHSALQNAASTTFDLVISDLGLPDGSGLELMRALTDRGPVKGIALSGYGMDNDVARSRDAGFIEHLTKPVDIRRLEEAIRRVKPL